MKPRSMLALQLISLILLSSNVMAGKNNKAAVKENAIPKHVSVTDPEYVKYNEMIRSKIMQEWVALPECSSDKTKIALMIDKSGNISQVKFVDKTEHEKCNEMAMNAIYKAAPLPLPPKSLEAEVFEEGFFIEFDRAMKK